MLLKSDSITKIAVDFKKNDLKIKSGLDDFYVDGTYHYNIYLPPGYEENKEARYPCLFVASPGGNAGLGKLKDWVKENRLFVDFYG